MAQKTKTRRITIVEERGSFRIFFKKSTSNKKDYDFKGLSAVRNLLSNEKARMLHTIKKDNPKSVYALAKILKRDFKSVSEDVRFLEKFGFLDLLSEKTGKRERLRPVVVIDTINLEIKL